jgi:hypothetical protein
MDLVQPISFKNTWTLDTLQLSSPKMYNVQCRWKVWNSSLQKWHLTRMWGTVTGAPQFAQMGTSSPCLCVRWVWTIWSGAIMTTSFVMKLKVDCHTCTDGVTGQNLFPSIWVQPSWHANKRGWGNSARKSMPTALSDHKTLCKTPSLVDVLVALLLGSTL